MSSCSEAESQFGDVGEEIQSTDRQEEELSERSNTGTTVNGAVVSTVAYTLAGPGDLRTPAPEVELPRLRAWDRPRPCRSGGGQEATCENAESIGGYDGRRTWIPEPEEYQTGRIVAERPPTVPCLVNKDFQMLLLPIGTASIKLFSAMNRILSSERCRLTPEHVNALMCIASIEGPTIPELRDADRNKAHRPTDEEFSALLEEAYRQWMKKPRRQ